MPPKLWTGKDTPPPAVKRGRRGRATVSRAEAEPAVTEQETSTEPSGTADEDLGGPVTEQS